MSPHCSKPSVLHSTGVLTREPATVSAVINIVNLDAYGTQYVNIEVWDWSNYSNPVKLPVLIGEDIPVEFPYLLKGNNLAVFYADIGESSDLYEICISYPTQSNIIANCFGRSLPPYTSQEGNTVYHKQLVRIY
ncbi:MULTISPECIES: hypothetical protein [Bacillus]|uniref:Group-specific protein n=2 Tax=Bacillus cereus group TaxID=86661 RepID=A0A164MAU6_BACCE|nr:MULTISPECIES: hypothetical protein [Bacillus]KZD58304.1 hypothetical protein B4088_4586 [Bacillus cereus]MDG1620931.1 hypothetical protein [Bacillus mobilis]MDX5837739.1 hypothetical protein [Bacillus cereus group sp. BfR-BA-01700]MED4385382.1 hypothetical protein [Bacillus mobilis]NEK99282.1 hypothetical protein [Bacillus mobilis]